MVYGIKGFIDFNKIRLRNMYILGKPVEPVKCQNCNRVYKNKTCLRSHISQDCGKNARFKCPLCQYIFKRKHNLKQHLIGKHGLIKFMNLDS